MYLIKKKIQNLDEIERYKKNIFLFFLDLMILNVALYLSWYLRLDKSVFNKFENIDTINFLLLTIFNIFLLYFFSFYRSLSRFVNIEILKNIILANSFFLIFVLIINLILSKNIIPKSILLIYFFTSTFALVFFRWSLVSFYNYLIKKINFKKNNLSNILLFNYLKKNQIANLVKNLKAVNIDELVGISNKNVNLSERGFIFGKKFRLLKNINELKNLKNKNLIIDKNLFEINEFEKVSKYINLTNNNILSVQSHLNQKNENLKLIPFSYDKYLGRNKIITDFKSLNKVLKGKSILVTGAGGSIGSELCNIISMYKVKKLVALDHSELNLFKLNHKVSLKLNTKKYLPLMGSITDKKLINKVIKKNKIDILIHAAAYKHVNLVEGNVLETFKNNVIGTKNCIDASVENKISNFVLVSSDKAENPKSTMGITKRICENLISQIYEKNKNIKTSLSSVRFGNVWNSSGSVVEIFKNQIKNKETITVTNKNATRYFMLISEAAELILQSILYPQKNAIYILDIGTPINIYNLAKTMIEEARHKNNYNYKIKFIGLSKKEKMHETLYPEKKELLITKNKKIKYFKNDINVNHFNKKINFILKKINTNLSDEQLKKYIMKLI